MYYTGTPLYFVHELLLSEDGILFCLPVVDEDCTECASMGTHLCSVHQYPLQA